MPETDTLTPVEDLTIHDFTITVDTRESGGDKLVVHLAREGAATLTLAAGANQFLWLVDDPEYFTQALRFGLFKRIAELRDENWTFDRIGAELGVDARWARDLHEQMLAQIEAQKEAQG